MEDTDSMEFRGQLLSVDENLGKDGVEAFKFLCRDLISSKKLESVDSAQEIFQHLINEDFLNKEDSFLIVELLYRIKYYSLLKTLGYTKEEVQEKLPLKGRVSDYRQMLYEISEDLTEEDVRTAMFLLRFHLPKKQSAMTALELLTALEKQDLLAETNLDLLKNICHKISPELLCRVNRYEQNKAICQANKKSAPASFTKQPLGNIIATVSVQKPSIKDAPNNKDSYTEAFGSLKEHVTSIHSLPANQDKSSEVCFATSVDWLSLLQTSLTSCSLSPASASLQKLYSEEQGSDVKEGNIADLSEMNSRLSVGNDESKSTAEKPALYKMDGPNRGYCLIFNNTNFVGLQERRGSEFDAMALECVFKWLGLEVKMYDDKTSTDMREILQKWQSSESWKDIDCFVCCILSHGKSGMVYGTDGVLVQIRTIMSYFTAKRCPKLAQKPKLFFIQACQGEKIQEAFKLEADSGDPTGVQADAQTSAYISSQQMASSIPDEADFLLGMATVDGYLCFRSTKEGTWYIQALCKKLQDLVPRGEDILSILTEVNEDVSKRADTQGQKKQMPQPAYTLRKKLIFPKPAVPFPSLQ